MPRPSFHVSLVSLSLVLVLAVACQPVNGGGPTPGNQQAPGSTRPAADSSEARGAATAHEAPRTVALGIWVPDLPWEIANLIEQEAATGKRNAIVNLFFGWDEAVAPPPLHLVQRVVDRGSIPLISWMPHHHGFGRAQPDFTLAEILSGRYDAYISTWATSLADFRHRVLLRFAHEMNGDWYSWGHGVNGNRSDQFIAVWRHVHSIFMQAGATNVEWVWSPNIDNDDPALFFPGDEYVDWLGMVGFNNADWGLWRSFTDIFAPTYDRITQISKRPVMVTEVGTTEGNARVGGDKAAWIRSMYEVEIPTRFQRIVAVVWFDEDKRYYGEGNYALRSTPEALQAYRLAISSDLYVSRLE